MCANMAFQILVVLTLVKMVAHALRWISSQTGTSAHVLGTQEQIVTEL